MNVNDIINLVDQVFIKRIETGNVKEGSDIVIDLVSDEAKELENVKLAEATAVLDSKSSSDMLKKEDNSENDTVNVSELDVKIISLYKNIKNFFEEIKNEIKDIEYYFDRSIYSANSVLMTRKKTVKVRILFKKFREKLLELDKLIKERNKKKIGRMSKEEKERIDKIISKLGGV